MPDDRPSNVAYEIKSSSHRISLHSYQPKIFSKRKKKKGNGKKQNKNNCRENVLISESMFLALQK